MIDITSIINIYTYIDCVQVTPGVTLNKVTPGVTLNKVTPSNYLL